jgi:Spy/CpxP family protein refolding chaperone
MRATILFFIAVIVVAAGAALGTRALMDRQQDHADDTMHRWLHDKLDLTAAQREDLHQIELKYADEERQLRSRLDEANRALARVIREDSSYTPRVGAAVEEVHMRMGELQKLSIAHLFEMRAHLTDEQNERLLHLAEMALTNAP